MRRVDRAALNREICIDDNNNGKKTGKGRALLSTKVLFMFVCLFSIATIDHITETTPQDEVSCGITEWNVVAGGRSHTSRGQSALTKCENLPSDVGANCVQRESQARVPRESELIRP